MLFASKGDGNVKFSFVESATCWSSPIGIPFHRLIKHDIEPCLSLCCKSYMHGQPSFYETNISIFSFTSKHWTVALCTFWQDLVQPVIP